MRLINMKEMYFLGNGEAGIRPRLVGPQSLYSFSTHSTVRFSRESPGSALLAGRAAKKCGLPASFPQRLLH